MMISLPLQNTHHPLPTTAAGPQRLTLTRRHHYNKKGGRARKRTAPAIREHLVYAIIRNPTWAIRAAKKLNLESRFLLA